MDSKSTLKVHMPHYHMIICTTTALYLQSCTGIYCLLILKTIQTSCYFTINHKLLFNK